MYRSFINVVFIYFVGDDSIETEMKLLLRYPGIQVEFMLAYATSTLQFLLWFDQNCLMFPPLTAESALVRVGRCHSHS